MYDFMFYFSMKLYKSLLKTHTGIRYSGWLDSSQVKTARSYWGHQITKVCYPQSSHNGNKRWSMEYQGHINQARSLHIHTDSSDKKSNEPK